MSSMTNETGRTINNWDIQADLVESANTQLIENALAQVGSDPAEARRWQGASTSRSRNLKLAARRFTEIQQCGASFGPSTRTYHTWRTSSAPSRRVAACLRFFRCTAPEAATMIENDRVKVASTDEAISALVGNMIATAAFAASVDDDAERVVSRMVAPLGEDIRSTVVAAALEGAGLR